MIEQSEKDQAVPANITSEGSRDSRRIYEDIKARASLPSPTGVALEILRLAQSERTSIDEIATAVESDPATAARLLKLVNSPLAGATRQIVSVTRAVALLGVRTVTSLALGFSLVANNRNGLCADFDYDLFWSESLAQGVGARHLTARLGSFAPDEAFTCGLLCQIGRLALASVNSEREVNVDPGETGEDHDESDHHPTTFEIDAYDLTAEMMADWHLPAIFQVAVRAQKNPDAGHLQIGSRAHQLAQVLRLAGAIARILPRSTVYRDALSSLLVEADRLGIAPDTYHEVFDSISREWREAGAIFSIRTRRVPPLTEIYALAHDRQIELECKGSISAPELVQGRKHDARS